jgi:hypothetical protein
MSAVTGFLAALLAPISLNAPRADLPAKLVSEPSHAALMQPALALMPFATPMLLQAAASGGSGPYGSHLYWELEIDANNGNASNTSLGEFTFFDAGATQIPTTGGTAFSGGSGTDSSGASNAFDGNTGTTWLRGSPTNTKIGYHFASAVAVASIGLLINTTTTTAPKNCRLRYSDDGITYTTAFEIWEPSWPASGSATRTWPQDTSGGKYKALRLRYTADNGDRFLYIDELEFRGSVGGSDQANGGVSLGSDNTVTPDAWSPLFDNNNASGYAIDTAATALPQWEGYAFPAPVLCAQYTIRCSSSNARCPKDWKLQGTNDGVTWTDLNTQTGVTGWSVPETKSFTV